MKKYLSVIVAAIAILSSCATPPPQDKLLTPEFVEMLSFQGEDYFLVYSAENESNLICEYLKEDESLNDWETMITIFEWKQAQKIVDILPSYIETVKNTIIEMKPILKAERTEKKEDIFLRIFFKDPHNKYLEFDVHRIFTDHDDRVYSIIFAIKIPIVEGRVEMDRIAGEEFERDINTWMNEIGKLNDIR